MADKTGISWTDATWNPVRGCSRVSPGCQNCYAETQAARIVRMAKGKPSAYDGLVRVTAGGEARWTGKVRLVSEQLAWPLRKRKPLRIFVNSMSDLFHESLTNEQIAAVFGVMAACPQHTFQVLTKRARRMRDWFDWAAAQEQKPTWTCADRALESLPNSRAWNRNALDFGLSIDRTPWPLPNVWLGVSVENQDAADERISELLRTPAAVRFLSCEPLIGPVDLGVPRSTALVGATARKILRDHGARGPVPAHLAPPPSLDWIIAGCESGPGARPCSVDWLRSLRDQCAAADVAFFCKQAVDVGDEKFGVDCAGNTHGVTCGTDSKRKPGNVIERPYLDGRQHLGFPPC